MTVQQTLEALLAFLLDQNAFDKALYYLNEEWQSDGLMDKVRRLEWLSHLYHLQKDTDALIAVLGEVFELQPLPERLRAIMSVASPAQQSQWRKRAYELAGQQENVSLAVSLLLQIGETALATQVAVARHAEFADVHYTTLTHMLKTFPEACDTLQVILYRRLLDDILGSSRSKAYGHAARYYKKLMQLDATLAKEETGYTGLMPHEEYNAALRKTQGKKRSFWEKIKD